MKSIKTIQKEARERFGEEFKNCYIDKGDGGYFCGNYIKQFLNQEIEIAVREVLEGVRKKVDEAYTECENEKPPPSFNKVEAEYNGGMYQGRLNACERIVQTLQDIEEKKVDVRVDARSKKEIVK